MNNQIKGFEDYISILEGKNFLEIPKDPIIYKGYYIIAWPWRNDERHPDRKWGFTVSVNPEGKNYLSKSKGPVGNYEEACKQAEDVVDNLVQKSIQ